MINKHYPVTIGVFAYITKECDQKKIRMVNFSPRSVSEEVRMTACMAMNQAQSADYQRD